MRLSQQWSVVGYYRIIPSHGNNHWAGIGWMRAASDLNLNIDLSAGNGQQ
jgi:hypothetical protein